VGDARTHAGWWKLGLQGLSQARSKPLEPRMACRLSPSSFHAVQGAIAASARADRCRSLPGHVHTHNKHRTTLSPLQPSHPCSPSAGAMAVSCASSSDHLCASAPATGFSASPRNATLPVGGRSVGSPTSSSPSSLLETSASCAPRLAKGLMRGLPSLSCVRRC